MKAIVIAEDHYNGLGVIRSLGECNIEVALVLLSESPSSMIENSRYVSTVIRVNLNEDEIVKAISELIVKNETYYLYPLCDFAAIVCDKNVGSWGYNVIVPNAKGNIAKFQDKKVFSELAKDCGIVAPSNCIVEQSTKLNNIAFYPVIIKPLMSIDGHKADIVTVNNQNELEVALKRFWEKGYQRVLVEQYICGKDEYMIEIMGISDGENVLFSRCIKKIREYPVKNGSTAYAELTNGLSCIDISKIRKLLKRVKFDGLFDVEFKYANGKAYFLELNFRNGAPSYVSTLDGFNLPINWMLLHEDKNVQNLKKDSVGIHYFMIENRDILNVLKNEVKLGTWLKQYRTSQKVFFVSNDKKPCYYSYWNFVKFCIGKVFLRR